MPIFSQKFSIECDTQGKGITVVLTQNKIPIVHFGKASADSTIAKFTSYPTSKDIPVK